MSWLHELGELIEDNFLSDINNKYCSQHDSNTRLECSDLMFDGQQDKKYVATQLHNDTQSRCTLTEYMPIKCASEAD